MDYGWVVSTGFDNMLLALGFKRSVAKRMLKREIKHLAKLREENPENSSNNLTIKGWMDRLQTKLDRLEKGGRLIIGRSSAGCCLQFEVEEPKGWICLYPGTEYTCNSRNHPECWRT